MPLHVMALERYLERRSFIHGADARLKTGLTFVFILSVATLPIAQWPYLAVFGCLIWATVAISHIGIVRALKRTFLVLPFLVVAIPSLFTRQGDPMWTWGAGVITLTPTVAGMEFVATIMLKSWISVTAAVMLSATTRFGDIVAALHWFRIPDVLAAVLAMMYRYVFVLVGEAFRLLDARRARSAETDGIKSGGTLRWRARVTGNMIGSLFIRTINRSERVHMAMVSRGYSGGAAKRSLGRLSGTEAVVFGLLVVAFLTLAVAGRLA